MGNQNSGQGKDSLEGRDVRQLDRRVSELLAKGVKYNMKILIRGERESGKTQLAKKLQGLKFEQNYTPTPEITTAHIIWNCKATDENVKVELWDVVDKGIQPKAEWAGVAGGGGGGAPVEASKQAAEVVLLDANTINVYQGCDGMILCYNPWKRETFDYAASLLKSLKGQEVPVLLVANFADQLDTQQPPAVTNAEVEKLLKGRDRWCSIKVCCKDEFGIEEVKDFFVIPFFCLKQRYAEKQLAHAQEQISQTRVKLDAYADTLNFAAHCAEWQQGGAARAKAQAARMQALQQKAKGQAAEAELGADTPKAKMVPIEKLILPPKVDENAPDLGREVASFNTGKLDENFFSSDDEVAEHVQVLGMGDSDEEPQTPGVNMKDDDAHSQEDDDEDDAPKRRSGRSEDTDPEEAEQRKRLEEEKQKRAEEEKRLEKIREAKEAKERAEQERLQAQIDDVGGMVGALDPGFLSDKDEDAKDESEEEEEESEDEKKKKKKTKKPVDSDSTDSEDGPNPHIMADEDFSD